MRAVRGGPWAPLAVLAVMVAEVVAFVALGRVIGFGITVLLVLFASLAGGFLLKREGLRAWRRFQQAAAAGTPPGRHLTDGVVGLGGALLLTVPGLVTGAAGLLLLTPPVRALARSRAQSRAERRMSSAEAGAMFGPRRVWVTEHRRDAAADGAAASDDGSAAEEPDEVLEGEIVDPADETADPSGGPARGPAGGPAEPPAGGPVRRDRGGPGPPRDAR